MWESNNVLELKYSVSDEDFCKAMRNLVGGFQIINKYTGEVVYYVNEVKDDAERDRLKLMADVVSMLNKASIIHGAKGFEGEFFVSGEFMTEGKEV